jgi:hypothetical protein
VRALINAGGPRFARLADELGASPARVAAVSSRPRR